MACKNYCFFSFSGSLAGALLELPAADELDSSFFGALGIALEGLDGSRFCTPEVGPGAVVEPELAGLFARVASSAPRSQPVSNPAPSARDTATAKVESLM